MKRLLFLFLSFLLIILTACSSDSSNDNTAETNEPKTYTLNEDVMVGSVAVKLNEIGYTTYAQMSYGVPVDAPEGKLFLYTSWSVGNGGENEVTISSEDFNCYIDNVQMPLSIYTNSITDGFPSIDTLSTGRIINGLIIFEVPENFDTVEFEFKPNMFEDDNAIFKVSKAQARNLNVPE